MWNDLKQFMLDLSGLGPNALHALLGVVIFCVALLVLRRPGLAFLTVVAFQVANEGLDAWFDIASGEGFKADEAVVDTVVTLAPAGIAWLFATLARRVRRA